MFDPFQAFITFLCLYGMVWFAENYGPRGKVCIASKYVIYLIKQ